MLPNLISFQEKREIQINGCSSCFDVLLSDLKRKIIQEIFCDISSAYQVRFFMVCRGGLALFKRHHRKMSLIRLTKILLALTLCRSNVDNRSQVWKEFDKKTDWYRRSIQEQIFFNMIIFFGFQGQNCKWKKKLSI
jgi:hypothetical protein